MSSTSSQDSIPNPPSSRTGNTIAWIALIIAVLFVIAVLVGAKITMDKSTYAPVSMGTVEAPEATSAQCAEIMQQLPDKVNSYREIDILDPAPVATAAWAAPGLKTMNLRCGVQAPQQYTALSIIHTYDSKQWIAVSDATQGSDLTTWYSVDSGPVIAITGNSDISPEIKDLSPALTIADATSAPAQAPFPLSTLASEATSSTATECSAFLDALPRAFGDFSRVEIKKDQGAGAFTQAWTADGKDPIVVRCGVSMPDSYTAGDRLESVNTVPWYSSPTQTPGAASGIWYGLGYSQISAVTLPTSEGSTVLPIISDAMVNNFTEEKPSS